MSRPSAYDTIGTPFSSTKNARNALERAGLGFGVRKVPLTNPLDPEQLIDGHFAVIRDDTLDVLGVVESYYTLLQNSDIGALAQILINEGNARITRVASVENGHKWFMFLDFPKRKVKVVGDIVRCKAIVRTCHDGKFSAKIMFLPMRLACSNGLVVAAKDLVQEIAIDHRQSGPQRVKDAAKILKHHTRYFSRFGRVAEVLAKTKVPKSRAEEIIKKAVLHGGRKETDAMKYRTQRILQLFDRYQINGNHEAMKGTAWGLLNAGVEYVDHHATQTRVPKGRIAAETLFESLVEGARFRLKARMFQGLEQDTKLGLGRQIQDVLAN